MKVLAIILLIYFLFKYLIRIFAPIIMRRFANKIKDRFQQQFNQNHHQYQDTREEGKVTIEKTKSSLKRKSTDLGEYVDFEEIDE